MKANDKANITIETHYITLFLDLELANRNRKLEGFIFVFRHVALWSLRLFTSPTSFGSEGRRQAPWNHVYGFHCSDTVKLTNNS